MGIRGKTYSYEYDVNGLRTRKTNSDGGYTEYYIMDGLTVAERKFNASNTEVYTMRYYFDEGNAPVGIGIQYPSYGDTYWENYYFAKNAQGDIIAIYNSNNGNPNLIATYEYDAWGKPTGIYNPNGAIISQTGINAAALNPFRYRGYRYDADTGFYYLQSRYYDPVIGRFINADGLASTGQGFIGYNMFAYCGNNSVNRQDASGNAWNGTNTVAINDGQGASQLEIIAFWLEWAASQTASYAADAYNYVTNDDEQVVFNAKHFAFYKGVPVVKLPIGNEAFSFGIIFLGTGVSDSRVAVETVKHEYGHSVHFFQIGLLAYTSTVFIPSLIGYWSGVSYDDYYSQPWEYIAEKLGKVNRAATGYTYASWTDTISKIYYWVTNLLP